MYANIRSNLIAREAGFHRHDHAQVLIGWHGRLSFDFESGGECLTRGGLSVVPAGTVHEYRGLSSDCELIVIDLGLPIAAGAEHEVSAMHRDLANWAKQPAFYAVSEKCMAVLDVYNQFCLGNTDQGAASAFNKKLAELVLSELMCSDYSSKDSTELNANTGVETTKGVTFDTSVTDAKVSRVDPHRLLAFIDANISCQLLNTELAELCYCSESHFYEQVKVLFGQTPQEIVSNRRISRAKQLLESCRWGLNAIAAEVGFADAASFSRAFKRHTGLTPGRYRQRHYLSPAKLV